MSVQPIIVDLVAICHTEPRSEYGLEGYRRGESYRCQFVDEVMSRHYRIYPSEPADHFDLAVPRAFTKFFQVEEKSS